MYIGPLHAFCQRIPMVVASVAEAEYAAAFGGGGGQVLVDVRRLVKAILKPGYSEPH